MSPFSPARGAKTRAFAVRFSVAMAIVFAAAAIAGDEPLYPPFFDDNPSALQAIRRQDGVEWRLVVFNRGTRSEGAHGRLFVNGSEAIGGKRDEIIKTAAGVYVWHGSITDRRRLWDNSGWMPRSHDVLATPETEGEAGPDLWLLWREGGTAGKLRGDVRLGGHWLERGEPMRRMQTRLGEFVWEEQPDRAGWLPARESDK
jgi:hypothetical protein